MEAGTVAPAAASTGSKTIADLHGARRGASRRARGAALQARRRVAHALLRGARPDRVGDRAAASSTSASSRATASRSSAPRAPSGPRRTSRISSAGGVVVPIYPTNSPEECEWVAGNSESVAIVCEDAAQLAKIVEVRENLPALEHVIVIEPSGDVGDAISLDDLRERGRGRDEAELQRAPRGRHARGPLHVHLHLGHDRAAQGLRALAPQLPPGGRTCARSSGCSRRATSSTSSSRSRTPTRC